MQQYSMTNAQDAYRKQAILTASPIELIIMLYDGCRKNLLLAQRKIEKNDPAQTHEHLLKAQEIIAELINSLDMRYEISQELLDIYEFIFNELVQINMKKDAQAINPILEILEGLRGTWQEVADSQKSLQPPLALDGGC